MAIEIVRWLFGKDRHLPTGVGGKDNWRCRLHPRCRPSRCLKGKVSAMDLVCGDATSQGQHLFHKVEPSRIKFDIAPAGGTDTSPYQIAALAAIDGAEI